ncbi:MAG: diglucosyl diacylglycerol synthase [Candidatus Doudnabacteria bacterium]
MKILILYTSAGYGHKKIGENIGAALEKEHEVSYVDFFELQGGKIASWGTKYYLFILKYFPQLWEFFYTSEVFIKIGLPLRVKLAKYNSINLANLMINNHYDLVVSTQVTASAVVSYLKESGIYKGMFGITFSDFHLHPFWLYKNADVYFANIPEQKNLMIKQGIAAEKIFVCGITLSEPKELDKAQLRIKYSLTGNDKMILVLGGGRGLGIEGETITELAKTGAKVFIVCGLNETLKNRMEKFYGSKDVKVFGFVHNMKELYAIADIVVTKPGGLSIAECLEYNLPILITSYIPGQERLNYEYLAERSLIMPVLMDFVGPVEDELKTGLFAKEILRNEHVKTIVQHGSTVREAVKSLEKPRGNN